MQSDGSALRNGAEIATTVCIVGAGPAALTVASALSEAKIETLLVESGGVGFDREAQSLNEGEVVGDPRLRLHDTRRRQLGGTVNDWNTPVGNGSGAKYVPLDPWDLHRTAGAEVPGWPIDYHELEHHYPAAQEICGLGPFDYSASNWQISNRPPVAFPGCSLATKVYQFGPASRFLEDHLHRLASSDYVHIITNLTVSRLGTGTSSRIEEIRAVNRTGSDVKIRARLFVLAGGAIENARLLLVSAPDLVGMPRVAAAWIGRCFMEHPRDYGLALVTDSPAAFERLRFFDTAVSPAGVVTCGRLAFEDGPPRGTDLPNMSVTLLPRARPAGVVARTLQRFGLAKSRAGYGWTSYADPTRYFDGFHVLINLEQRPRPENRVTLSTTTLDAYGLPRCEVQWSWSSIEQSSLARLRALIAEQLEALSLGRVENAEARLPDPNAHHHAGTTRMAETPKSGVTDRDARVFGIDNLYVAGASVLPTAGFANPMLTIVALADRLGQHLAATV